MMVSGQCDLIAPSHPTRKWPSCYAHNMRAPAPPIPSGWGGLIYGSRWRWWIPPSSRVWSPPREGPGDVSVCCVRMGPWKGVDEGMGEGGEIGDGEWGGGSRSVGGTIPGPGSELGPSHFLYFLGILLWTLLNTLMNTLFQIISSLVSTICKYHNNKHQVCTHTPRVHLFSFVHTGSHFLVFFTCHVFVNSFCTHSGIYVLVPNSARFCTNEGQGVWHKKAM